MEKVNWTEKSLGWLNEIYEYIALDSPSMAASTVDKITEKVELLNDFPELGYRYYDIKKKHIRILLIGHL